MARILLTLRTVNVKKKAAKKKFLMIGGNCMRTHSILAYDEKKKNRNAEGIRMSEWEINWMKLNAIKVYNFWVQCSSSSYS